MMFEYGATCVCCLLKQNSLESVLQNVVILVQVVFTNLAVEQMHLALLLTFRTECALVLSSRCH